MAIYYIRTDGNDTNTGLVDSASTPNGAWATLAYAATHTTSGDTIIFKAGTFTGTTQILLPVGVNLQGQGVTSIIKSTYSDTYEGFLKLQSTAGTNGNQTISNLKFDGNALATGNGILIQGRSNVIIHDCTFVDFLHSAIIYNGEDHFTWDVTAARGTGNAVYNCTISNCAGLTGGDGGNGDGCLQMGRQTGMLVYNNTIVQNQRASGSNGWCIKYYADGYLDGCKIYNNTFTKIPYANDGWDFSVELWHLSGLEFYNNTVQGSLDLNFNYKGDYEFSAWVHDNTFSQVTQNTHKESGIFIEFEAETMIIENNTFSKISTPLVFVPRNGDHVTNFIFRRNKCVDLGVSGNPDINFISWFTGANVTVDGYYIYNNTFVGLTGVDKPYSGLKFLEAASGVDRRNIYIQNNIIQNTQFGGIQFAGASPLDFVFIQNNDLYQTSGVAFTSVTPTNYTNSGNISVDPLFVGSGDYTLQSTSPCRNSGIDVGYPFEGVSPDMGYNEYGFTDITSPTIVTTSPINLATGVSTVLPKTINFSEITNPGTINSTNIQLKQLSTVIPCSVDYKNGKSVNILPDSELLSFTAYTLNISNLIKDAAGNQLDSSSVINFTTGPLANVPPVVNAGIDQSINLPTSSTTLTGTATDSDGTVASVLWSFISGPNTPTIVTPSTLTTSITGLVEGTYIFQLTATDNSGDSSSDTIRISVRNPSNVYATWNPSDKGTNLVLSNSNKTVTEATDNIDLVRATIGKSTGAHYWEVIPTFSGTGANLKIGVSKSTSLLNAQPAANDIDSYSFSPIGWSANNGNINFNYVVGGCLSGDVIGIGLNNGTIRIFINGVDKGVMYSGLSGTFYPSVSFYSQSGSVVANFGATDLQYPQSGYNNGIYNASANIPPIANAGIDQFITQPTSSVTMSGSASDSDGTIISKTWSQISGPNTATITTPTSYTTTITNLIPGTYTFRLSASDDSGYTSTDDMQVIVTSAIPTFIKRKIIILP